MVKRRFIYKRSKKSALPPGTLIHVGEKREETVKISVIDYDKKKYEEKNVNEIEECFPFKETSTVTWINIDGVHQVEVIEKLGKYFNIHPLILEDVVNTGQRPKYDDMGTYLYIVLQMVYTNGDNEIETEQVSLIVGSNFLISFQEKEGDVFNPIRERIKDAKGRIRTMGVDYLAYTLVDAIVDNYFSVLERIGEKIETLEEELVGNPQPTTLQTIHRLKRNGIILRKSVWPLREVISGLERGEPSIIQDSTRIFFRDVYDHTIQVIDTIETFRDMISGMLDIYLSSISNKMNEVMKVLTIIATTFIPMTFIAGVYGMNFKYMPELEWRWGYLVVWVVMIGIGVSLLHYFKKKKWI